jgi:SAM-dependent methyltransferase
MSTDVRRYYDAYWAAGPVTALPRALLEVIEANLAGIERVLDVGCGDASAAGGWLAGRCPGYVGVDVSPAAVEAARARGFDARVIEDAGALPFAEETFDGALCTEVLEHLFDPLAALEEIRRVLRPGATVVVTVPNVAHWRYRLDLALFGRFNPRADSLSASEPWRDPHLRFFTQATLARMLARAGLDPVEAGGHCDLGFMQMVPGMRRLASSPAPGGLSSRLAASLPRLFANRLHGIARKP